MDLTFDSGTVRGLITATLIVLFMAMVFWAYSAKRRGSFDAASRLPLEEDREETR